MKLNKLLTVLFLIIIAICLNSCGQIAKARAKKKFTEKNGAIPPEFGKFDNQVFLITLRKRSSYDKYLKNASKRYLGQIEFIEQYGDQAEKYKQTNIYRYIFDYVDGSTTTVMYSDGMRNSMTHKQFYIRDRLTGKTYICGFETPSFGKALKAYMENLELKRLSYK